MTSMTLKGDDRDPIRLERNISILENS